VDAARERQRARFTNPQLPNPPLPNPIFYYADMRLANVRKYYNMKDPHHSFFGGDLGSQHVSDL
jgi:hypothetical protein